MIRDWRGCGPTRPASKLIGAVAPKVWGAVQRMGFAWAEIRAGFPASVSVRGKPSGEGIFFGSPVGKGLEVVLDREGIDYWIHPMDEWSSQKKVKSWILFGSSIFEWDEELSKYEARKRWAWRLRKVGGWSCARTALCSGKRHEVLFTDRGVRSPHHRPEELLLLEKLGEGCGALVQEWRKRIGWKDTFGEWSGFFSWRSLRDSREDPNLRERWNRVLRSMIREELAVSGIQGVIVVYLDIKSGMSIALKVGRRSWRMGKLGPGNAWFRNVWKRGLRASKDRFPLETSEDRTVWLVRSRSGVMEIEEPLR